MKISDYRAIARKVLSGHWLESVMMVFLYTVVACVISGATSVFGRDNSSLALGGSLLGSLLALPLEYGLYYSFLRQGRNIKMEVGDLFCGYNKRVWSTKFLQYVYTMLWSLLLIIPGIIKYYSYLFTSFVMTDDPEISGNEAIEKSMAMTQGHKWRLFLLDLSFIGWAILALVFTFGIGMLWVSAYNYQARVAYYEEVKAAMEPQPQVEYANQL